MEIRHRVAFNSSTEPQFLKVLMDLRLNKNEFSLPADGSSIVAFVLSESNDQWPSIARLISTTGAVDIVDTYFSEEEVRSAEWLRLISTFEQGYPYPKGPWPFKQTGRPLLCPKCATYSQTGPIQFYKEPNLGKKSFISLIWQNEIFCSPKVFHGLAEINSKGYEQWDAMIHKTGQASEKIQQLFVQNIAFPGVIVDYEHERIVCPVCGVTKFNPHMRGVMQIRRESIVLDTDFMLTYEWFGHGLLAWREILVSNRVAKLILDKGWQGVRFKVVELT